MDMQTRAMIKSDYCRMPPELPGPLRLASSSPFVGRSPELTTLRTLLPRQGEGRRVALVGGEAGSGKSRLVREFAQEVTARGVLVLYGAGDPVVRTPFGPFVEALRHLVRTTGPELLRGDLGPTGGELVRLLPELHAVFGGLPAPVETDPDTGRHRLHTAVSDLLSSVGDRAPLLVALEDGHWADEPTLLLLRHLVRATAHARMLVLATFRDTEADVPLHLADTLADLRRSDDVVRIKLGGLGEESIADFVQRSAGNDHVPADAALVTSMRDLTEGNAFFLCELWRTLVETDAVAVRDGAIRLTRPLADVATPDGVREVVSQRLLRLEPATRHVLELAAVVGSEFELDLLGAAAAPGLDHAAAVESAARSGIVEELPAPPLAYRFTHELVRRALADRLSGLRRAQLHLAVAEALERARRPVTGQVLAGLAHHYTAAVPVGGRERAIEYNRRAAEAAGEAMAFGEAVARLRTALQLGVEDLRQRAEMQIALGTDLYRAGMSLDSLAPLRDAAGVARDLGSGELLARAAIAFENACTRPPLEDQGSIALLEEASELLSPRDSPLRVRLLASLTRAFNRVRGDYARGIPLRREAIGMARRLDDRAGLATVLVQAYWSDLDRREVIEMLGEGRDLAAGLGDIDLEAEARAWRVAALMTMGEFDAAERERAVFHELAAQTKQPFHLHVAEHLGSALALLAGRLDDAQAAAERSQEWGRLLTGRDASSVYGIQMFGIRRERGELQRFEPAARVLAGAGGAWRPGLAALLVEIGLHDEARRELRRIRAAGLDAFRHSLWVASLTYLADACSAAGDAELAALVYPELAPLSGAGVVIGDVVACYGAADRYLGMLAATVGDLESAERHFEAALALNRRMGARTWLAHTAYEYGRMLRRRGDGERARRLLGEAGAMAQSLGMTALLGRVRVLLELAAPEPEALPDDLSQRELDVLRLLATGLSNRRIGAELHISEHTAANHVRSILSKTGTANRTEATAYAFRQGLAWSPGTE
jgi:DNA-binding CsgD family transcriptional regulator